MRHRTSKSKRYSTSFTNLTHKHKFRSSHQRKMMNQKSSNRKGRLIRLRQTTPYSSMQTCKSVTLLILSLMASTVLHLRLVLVTQSVSCKRLISLLVCIVVQIQKLKSEAFRRQPHQIKSTKDQLNTACSNIKKIKGKLIRKRVGQRA